MLAAVNRGVKVTLISNGLKEAASYARFFVWGNRISYVPLFYGIDFHLWQSQIASREPLKKTEIFEYDVEGVWLHKKMMLIDRETLLVGSYNLGIKSAYGDYEIVLVIHSREAALDAFRIFERDLSYSRKITAEQAREWYFDPVISMLGHLQKKFSGLL